MKKAAIYTILVLAMVMGTGCTEIRNMEPQSGVAGAPVYVKCGCMFGNPAKRTLKWDGKTICNPFLGSFTVPSPENGGTPGKHRVTLVDNLDADEALLLFPMFRLRHDSVTFVVTE